MSSWIQHVKDVQAKHGVSYKEAMSMAKGSYHKGSASKTRPGHEDFMAHKGTKSKTRPGHEDYMAHKGTKSKTRPGHIDFEGGAVGDIAFAPSSVPAFGNTNLGVMRVPQAHIPFQVVNASGQTKRPKLRGRGVINELGNQNYIAQLYNQKDLGANGVVRL
jgi:hypothetical protein